MQFGHDDQKKYCCNCERSVRNVANELNSWITYSYNDRNTSLSSDVRQCRKRFLTWIERLLVIRRVGYDWRAFRPDFSVLANELQLGFHCNSRLYEIRRNRSPENRKQDRLKVRWVDCSYRWLGGEWYPPWCSFSKCQGLDVEMLAFFLFKL